MKTVLEFLGFVALVQCVMGLVQEFTDWDGGLVARVAFLDDYGIFASVTLLVLACALFAAAESRRSR
jgi:hypothetical protein